MSGAPTTEGASARDTVDIHAKELARLIASAFGMEFHAEFWQLAKSDKASRIVRLNRSQSSQLIVGLPFQHLNVHYSLNPVKMYRFYVQIENSSKDICIVLMIKRTDCGASSTRYNRKSLDLNASA